MSQSSGARADVLAAVRRAMPGQTGDRGADYASVARNYKREGQLSEEDRLALFARRLEDYNVGVRGARADALAAVIALTCSARGRRRMLVPHGVPSGALPGSLEILPDDNLAYHVLDRCDGVLTTATIAIAVTGTIVLTHREGEGRRALTLIPDYHLCIVRAEQVVETVPEAVRQLQALAPALVTTISGPSATADIEMIRVRGVHGPRTLDVVIVSP